MNIDFQAPGTWFDLNEAIENELQLENAEARAYLGLNHALAEITQGLAKQFPHKKKVFYFRHMDPFLEDHMVHLVREGYSVNRLKLDDLEQPENFAEKIDREALFVIYSEDDPLLGRRYPLQVLEEALSQTKAFQIAVSHSAHLYQAQPKTLGRHQVRIHSIQPHLCLGLLGGRARIGSLVADGLSWNLSLLEEFKRLKEVKEINDGPVRSFEQSQPGEAQVFFKDDKRLFDRAVLYWEDMDGSAFIHYLAQELGLELKPPGYEDRLETTSLSRWGGVKTMDWLKAQGLETNQIRGMVMIDQSLVDDNLPELFAKVRKHVCELQEGSKSL